MFDNGVNSCSCCGLHGCQRVTIIRKTGGDMRAAVSLATNPVEVNFSNISKGIKSSFSLVCRTSQSALEYLMVKEGEILLIDGQKVLVKRSKD